MSMLSPGARRRLSRTALLLGAGNMEKLRDARVIVFGLGGVGGYAAEALARSGVGSIDLVDNDVFTESNMNRQLHALLSTVGAAKVDVAAERIRDLDPEIRVRTHRLFFSPEVSGQFDFKAYDYVIDAIDTVTGKLELATRCHEAGTPLISCMGAGNKLDPTAFEVTDIFQTSFDPLARIMRKELRRRGIKKLTVVYSREPALVPDAEGEALARAENPGRRDVPGSSAFVPAAAGLIAASRVVLDLTGGPAAGHRGE